ncbi:YqgQ family protein [Gracilibacillus oryzae]|uniref:YqgQ family protein n=1 Tax=Gracilibacillus oryzae TaxID=1672701 RepID=A0A7C8GRY4_9BACI|nr:YqgQ family protein [Gracilibacillus oryzae]KAB8128440.1 YqgQ family protein [Gracilibacillus oryzae]
MNSIYDIRKLLLKFGTVIYIGDRLADLELMEEEIMELYQVKMITKEQFLQSRLIIKREIEKTKRELDGENDK